MVVFLMTCLLQQAVAQDKSVSGRVTEGSNGQGLPGVTVLAKGTKIGTATNAEGQFILSVPASTTTLIFSSVGFKSTERDVTSASTVDVAMAVEVRNLDEVVVSGLATNVKRANLANAITTVSAKELIGSTRPVTVDAALSGKIVGANISQTSGAPGGGVSVQLRGISTLTGSSQPLYIIDGVYAVNDEVGNGAGSAAFSQASGGAGRTTQDNAVNRISDINPNDIESIEVLKGSSAAAIYGQRASNGVIIIRTKRGTAGQTRVGFTQDLGFAKAIRLLGKEDFTPEKIDLLRPLPVLQTNPTPAQVVTFNAALADTRAARADEKQLLTDAINGGRIYDYEKEIFGNTGFVRNTTLNMSGGNDLTKFYVSGTTTDEGGIVKNTGFARHSIRANVDQKLGKRIDIGLTSNYTNSKNRRGFTGNDNAGVGLGYTLAYVPSYAQLRPNAAGVFPDNPYGGDNPLAIVERSINEETTNRTGQAITGVLRILEGEKSSLRLNVQGGIDYANTSALLALPADLQSQRGLPNPGAVRVVNNRSLNTNLQAFLVYDWTLGENISLTSQLGTVRLRFDRNFAYSQGQNLAPGTPLNPGRSSLVTQDATSTTEQDLGQVVQQDINFHDQIILGGSVRFDKSSRNGDANKYYAFPSGRIAVNLTKFSFFDLPSVNLVKFRAAYGETGAPAFFGSIYSPLNNVSIGGRPGFIPSTVVGNKNIEPERATELEAGLDLGFLDNRITLEASVYQKYAKNLVQTFNLAPGTGVTSIRAFPVGDLRNRGLELSLGVTPVRSDNFSWTSTTLYSLNRTEVTRIVVPSFNTGSGFGSTFGRNIFTLGQSPSRWFGSPISAVDNPNTFSNLTRYEEAQPRFIMSFINNFTIAKSVEVNFLVAWRKDSYTSNLSRLLKDEGGTTVDWSKDDDGDGEVNGIQRQGGTAREFIQNSGFVRLREASIYYSLPASLRTSVFKEYVRNIRVGVSGNNLLTFTKYVGYDPEVSVFGSTTNVAQVDVTSFPNTRRVFFHLNLDF